MRIPIWLTVVATALALAVVIFVAQFIVQPDLPLIVEAQFSNTMITPNADGDNDITEFQYTLSRNARVSLTFENTSGELFAFRQNEARGKGDYTVLFSGVVDGYVREDETINGDVLRRLIPNGDYTWRFTAITDAGETQSLSGSFTIQDGDSPLPDLLTFSISPDVFTPNQDGISDRTQINVYLSKAAELNVYLVGPDERRISVARREECRQQGEEGRHCFDYEGGVDLGADPPPDGTYTVIAHAQDAVGQVVQRSGTLTIQDGGKPFAEIAAQAVGVDVIFEVLPYDANFAATQTQPGALLPLPDNPATLAQTDLQMPLGSVLAFKLTVHNYSNVLIRTTGPEPGTVYQQDQRAAALGWLDEPGAWRVGVDCDTAMSDYPWRWAVGTRADLTQVEDPVSGSMYFYLPPNTRSVVWGAVQLTEINSALNPQNCWAGLIHEGVGISQVNQRVGARSIELVELQP